MTEKKGFFKKALEDMKESAKNQHEVDKAVFNAVKAESKANFEENRGSNTFKKAKEDAKASWNAAKLSPNERKEKEYLEQQRVIADANERQQIAEEKLKELKENKD